MHLERRTTSPSWTDQISESVGTLPTVHCACTQELGKMGYKFQFVTLAGFHSLNYSMFELSHGYGKRGMAAYSELQQREFGAEKIGYTATKCVPFSAKR